MDCVGHAGPTTLRVGQAGPTIVRVGHNVTRLLVGHIVVTLFVGQIVTTLLVGQSVTLLLGGHSLVITVGGRQAVTTDRVPQATRGTLIRKQPLAGTVLMGLIGPITAGVQFTAALASNFPAPQAVFGTGPVFASSRADVSKHLLICACVRSGFFCNIRAMVPVT